MLACLEHGGVINLYGGGPRIRADIPPCRELLRGHFKHQGVSQRCMSAPAEIELEPAQSGTV